jgi:hypothetical protein
VVFVGEYATPVLSHVDQVNNDAIWVRDEAYRAREKLSPTEIQGRVITQAKTTEARAWLSEMASVALVGVCAGRAPRLPHNHTTHELRAHGEASDSVLKGHSQETMTPWCCADSGS